MMQPQFYGYLSALVLLLLLGRIVWRSGPKDVDWQLAAAFVRLDFPADQRDVAQKLAAGFAEIVGMKIKRLRPESTLSEIAGWSDEPIQLTDLIKVLKIAYDIACEPGTSFRALVETVAAKQSGPSTA
jgi:hypothetical protein